MRCVREKKWLHSNNKKTDVLHILHELRLNRQKFCARHSINVPKTWQLPIHINDQIQ